MGEHCTNGVCVVVTLRFPNVSLGIQLQVNF